MPIKLKTPGFNQVHVYIFIRKEAQEYDDEFDYSEFNNDHKITLIKRLDENGITNHISKINNDVCHNLV